MQYQLFVFARSQVGKNVVKWIFSNMSFILPVKRLRETEWWVAFHHPQPEYPVHILLVTKGGISSVMDIPGEQAAEILRDLLLIVQSLVLEFQLGDGYRLVTNGGKYQDIPILHFHLVAGESDTIRDSSPR
jgi:histidine triad (HIT) family protein